MSTWAEPEQRPMTQAEGVRSRLSALVSRAAEVSGPVTDVWMGPTLWDSLGRPTEIEGRRVRVYGAPDADARS